MSYSATAFCLVISIKLYPESKNWSLPNQSWTLGALKVTTISIPMFCKKVAPVPITVHFLKATTVTILVADSRYFLNKKLSCFFSKICDHCDHVCVNCCDCQCTQLRFSYAKIVRLVRCDSSDQSR